MYPIKVLQEEQSYHCLLTPHLKYMTLLSQDQMQLTQVDCHSNEKENYLKSELSALIRRNDMQSSSFLVRKLKALSLLLRGDYVYFNSVKSFIRDMIR